MVRGVVYNDLSVLRSAAGSDLVMPQAWGWDRGTCLACAGRLLKPLFNVGWRRNE